MNQPPLKNAYFLNIFGLCDPEYQTENGSQCENFQNFRGVLIRQGAIIRVLENYDRAYVNGLLNLLKLSWIENECQITMIDIEKALSS